MAIQTKVEVKTASKKPPKHRSPNYPAIGLEEALSRAKTLQEQGGAKHHIPLSVAFDLWKYKSGAGNQVAAALKAFGLAVIQGKTDKREIKLTEHARRILLDADNKAQLLQVAAMHPSLHAELWRKYDGELPQSDAVIKNYLVVEREFNPSFVDKFISQFRSTIAFAGLSEGATIPPEEEEDAGEIDEITGQAGSMVDDVLERVVKKPGKESGVTPPQKGYLPFPLYLSKAQKASLYVPDSMTRKEFELLKRQIEHSLTIMEATILSDDDPTEN